MINQVIQFLRGLSHSTAKYSKLMNRCRENLSAVLSRCTNGIRNLNTSVLILMMIGLGGLGYYSNSGLHGLTFRFSPERIALANDSKLNYRMIGSYDQQCLKRYPEFSSDHGFQSCLVSQDLEPTLLLIGDSHSQQYHKVISELFPNESVMNISSARCLPFTRFKNNNYFASVLDIQSECSRVYLDLMSFLKSHKTIKAIYLMGRWDMRFGFGAKDRSINSEKKLVEEALIASSQGLARYRLAT